MGKFYNSKPCDLSKRDPGDYPKSSMNVVKFTIRQLVFIIRNPFIYDLLIVEVTVGHSTFQINS